jgi:hypothetical protein
MNILIHNFLADGKSTIIKSANTTKIIGNKKMQEDVKE